MTAFLHSLVDTVHSTFIIYINTSFAYMAFRTSDSDVWSDNRIEAAVTQRSEYCA